ncbi:putative protocadherin Fat 1 isoform 2 [Apostichopus japonicus]|uniref:Putative protocadherin Fat 1 isoform 2 n=1 Tax=Stichopus japonicus TaxID=307972 RepID=A0A2G8JTW4_STIJA|nr:putative protocadherin Fat 1 isoform 2 [Apostichopus japonicus]
MITNPCQNGGTCSLSGSSGFTCRCPNGFTGTTCSQADPCTPNPCLNQGVCVRLDTTNFICICQGTFTGLRCEQVQNACSTNPCQNGGTCSLSEAVVSPVDSNGFTGTTFHKFKAMPAPIPVRMVVPVVLVVAVVSPVDVPMDITGTTCSQVGHLACLIPISVICCTFDGYLTGCVKVSRPDVSILAGSSSEVMKRTREAGELPGLGPSLRTH